MGEKRLTQTKRRWKSMYDAFLSWARICRQHIYTSDRDIGMVVSEKPMWSSGLRVVLVQKKFTTLLCSLAFSPFFSFLLLTRRFFISIRGLHAYEENRGKKVLYFPLIQQTHCFNSFYFSHRTSTQAKQSPLSLSLIIHQPFLLSLCFSFNGKLQKLVVKDGGTWDISKILIHWLYV